MDNSKIAKHTEVTAQLHHKLLWIVFAAFAIRVAVRLYVGSEDFWVNGYSFFFGLAQAIAAGNRIGFSELTAFRVPLYPAFLALVTFGHKVFLPIVLSQSLIGAGTVLCAGLLARELFGSVAAIIAATIAAFYPYYVMHDTALQETSLYTFLTILAVFLLLRARRSGSGIMAACAGLALGIAVLTRVQPGAICTVSAAMAGVSRAMPNRVVEAGHMGRHDLPRRAGADRFAMVTSVAPT